MNEKFYPTKEFRPVRLYVRSPSKEYHYIEGIFVLSEWEMLFYSNDGKLDLQGSYNSVIHLEKSKDISKMFVEVHFKDFKNWIISVEREDVYNDLIHWLSKYLSPKGDPRSLEENVPAFQYILPFDVEEDGWDVYNPEKELKRLFNHVKKDTLMWSITHANKDYKVTKSYPEVLALPSLFDIKKLSEAAEYREKNRFPALSWIHPNQATITRCSQPLPGRLGNKRCYADEALITAIFQANPNKPLKDNKIVDARPYSNAMANRAKGAGFENTDYYHHCDIEFLGIENIHHMRDSLERLRKLVRSHSLNDTSWLAKLEGTSWMSHVHAVMKGAVRISKWVGSGSSIVLHCSHGWDRTAQLSALAQIIMDPHFRTIRGFEELIEKEWVSFGHKLLDRTGHLTSLFIDCVHQLLRQLPTSFEYNEKFLLTVLEHTYSCKFGTFLGNSERDRKIMKLREKTVSLWSFMNHQGNISSYKSPLYAPSKEDSSDKPVPLSVSYSQDSLVFWHPLYNRLEHMVRRGPSQIFYDKIVALSKQELGTSKEPCSICSNYSELEEKISNLEDTVSILENEKKELLQKLAKIEGNKMEADVDAKIVNDDKDFVDPLST